MRLITMMFGGRGQIKRLCIVWFLLYISYKNRNACAVREKSDRGLIWRREGDGTGRGA